MYKCDNEECSKFNLDTNTFVWIETNNGETTRVRKCGLCGTPVIELPSEGGQAPYIKTKSWLKDWQLVNVGRTADDAVFKHDKFEGG
jgi:hypothetical protein